MRMFQREMRELVAEVKARGPPPESDVSIAAHLLRLTDPSTGKPMEDDLLASEFGVYFAAGIESAGNAMTWTMYAPAACGCLAVLSCRVGAAEHYLCSQACKGDHSRLQPGTHSAC